MLGAWVALSSAALYGVSDFAGGSASRRLRVLPTTTLTYGFAASVLLAGVFADGTVWSYGGLLWGGIAGVFAIIGFLTFYAAMASGPMSLVSPLIALLESVVPVIVAVAIGERLAWWAWVAITFAVVSGVLIAYQRSPETARLAARTLTLALVAGVMLGLSVVALNAAPRDAGFGPGLMEVLTGLVILGIVGALESRGHPVGALLSLLDDDDRPTNAPSRRRAITVAAVSGVLLGAASVLLIVALHTGNLATVGVLVGLYPLATIVLARIIDKERLDLIQRTGIAIAIIASLALALA